MVLGRYIYGAAGQGAEIWVGAMGKDLWFGPSNRNLLVGTRGMLITQESLCGFTMLVGC